MTQQQLQDMMAKRQQFIEDKLANRVPELDQSNEESVTAYVDYLNTLNGSQLFRVRTETKYYIEKIPRS